MLRLFEFQYDGHKIEMFSAYNHDTYEYFINRGRKRINSGEIKSFILYRDNEILESS